MSIIVFLLVSSHSDKTRHFFCFKTTENDATFVLKWRNRQFLPFKQMKTEVLYISNQQKPTPLAFYNPRKPTLLAFPNRRNPKHTEAHSRLQPNLLTHYNGKILLCIGQGHLCIDILPLPCCLIDWNKNFDLFIELK